MEAPASIEEFRVHLADGSSMALSMVTRDGVQLRGEAYVSTSAMAWMPPRWSMLAGAGPLQRAPEAAAGRGGSVREHLVADQLAHAQHVEHAAHGGREVARHERACPGS